MEIEASAEVEVRAGTYIVADGVMERRADEAYFLHHHQHPNPESPPLVLPLMPYLWQKEKVEANLPLLGEESPEATLFKTEEGRGGRSGGQVIAPNSAKKEA